MKNFIKILLISLIFLLCFTHCPYENTPDCHEYFTIINNSNRTIYFSHKYNFEKIDTILPNYNPILSGNDCRINSMTRKSAYHDFCLESMIGKYFLYVFIFDAEVLEKIPWDTIRKNYMILRRYDLTVDSLNKLNWKIIYP